MWWTKSSVRRRRETRIELRIMRAKAMAVHRLMDSSVPFTQQMSVDYVRLIGDIARLEEEVEGL